jgi:thiamine pyrophosphokinase
LGARVLTGVPTVECWWGDQYVRVLHGPGRAVLEVEVGATVSLLAMHGPCTGVVISGTKWPLDGVELQPLAGLGVSNMAIEPRIELAVSLGVLSVFVTDGATP